MANGTLKVDMFARHLMLLVLLLPLLLFVQVLVRPSKTKGKKKRKSGNVDRAKCSLEKESRMEREWFNFRATRWLWGGKWVHCSALAFLELSLNSAAKFCRRILPFLIFLCPPFSYNFCSNGQAIEAQLTAVFAGESLFTHWGPFYWPPAFFSLSRGGAKILEAVVVVVVR